MATKAKRTNTLLMIAFAVILLVVIFVAYAYGHRVDFEKGNKEGLTTETNLQEKNLIVDEGKLNKCLEEADATYISRWNNMCRG